MKKVYQNSSIMSDERDENLRLESKDQAKFEDNLDSHDYYRILLTSAAKFFFNFNVIIPKKSMRVQYRICKRKEAEPVIVIFSVAVYTLYFILFLLSVVHQSSNGTYNKPLVLCNIFSVIAGISACSSGWMIIILNHFTKNSISIKKFIYLFVGLARMPLTQNYVRSTNSIIFIFIN